MARPLCHLASADYEDQASAISGLRPAKLSSSRPVKTAEHLKRRNEELDGFRALYLPGRGVK